MSGTQGLVTLMDFSGSRPQAPFARLGRAVSASLPGSPQACAPGCRQISGDPMPPAS